MNFQHWPREKFLLRLQRDRVSMTTAALTSPFVACAFHCFRKDLNRKARHGVPSSKAQRLPDGSWRWVSGTRPSSLPMQLSPERVPSSGPREIRLSRHTLLRRGASSCEPYCIVASCSDYRHYRSARSSAIATAPHTALCSSVSLSSSSNE